MDQTATQSSFFFRAGAGEAAAPGSERALYGTLFLPRGQPSGLGLVLCSGFGKDAVIFRTQLSTYARELASRGHAALRFDFGGYGDSDGEFEGATPATMCADIERALGELRRRSGCARLGLLGLRLGATLAAVVAARQPAVERLILWEPLPAPWKSMYNELRMTIATFGLQTSHLGGEVQLTREKIVENLLAGRPTRVVGLDFNVIHDGFPLSKGFVEGAMALDLLREPPPVRARTLVVHITESRKKPVPKDLPQLIDALRRGGAECALETAEVPMLPWVDGRHWMAESPEVFAHTTRWLEA